MTRSSDHKRTVSEKLAAFKEAEALAFGRGQ